MHSAEPDQGFGAEPGAAAYRAQALKALRWQEELGRDATYVCVMNLFPLEGDAQATVKSETWPRFLMPDS